MRVAAPRPNTALHLFEHGDQPCQRGRVETRSYRNAPTADQFHMEARIVVPRLPLQRRTHHQVDGNKVTPEALAAAGAASGA